MKLLTKIHMKRAQRICLLLALLISAGALIIAFAQPGHRAANTENLEELLESHELELSGYSEILEETGGEQYIIYYPNDITDIQSIPVYFSIAGKNSDEIKMFGKEILTLDQLNDSIVNSGNIAQIINSKSTSRDIFLPDGRIRRFVNSSLARGNWAADIITYDPKTGVKDEYTQIWNTGSRNPNRPQDWILHVRYADSKKQYVYDHKKDIWIEENPQSRRPEQLRIDPWTYLPVE